MPATDHRTRRMIEVEISASRMAFLAADERGDYAAADAEYQHLDALLDEYRTIPVQRTS